MSKRKHKHKKHNPRKNAQQHMKKISLVAVDSKSETENCTTGTSDTQNEQEHPMGFREVIKRSSLTDWLIMIFTGVLAGASIYQFIIMGGQLNIMQKDQRPWVKLSFDNFIAQVQSPIGGNLHMINSGKTPGKSLDGKFAIEKVRNGKEPRLDYGEAWVSFTTGTLFPNEPEVRGLAMQHTSGEHIEAVILSQADWDDYIAGKIFFVAYATVFYSDFSRTKHWTKYCIFLAPQTPVRTYTAKNCTDYNGVDDN